MAKVTDGELFKRVYTRTHEAADVLAPMVDYAGLTPHKVTALRNLLRSAFCAAQELKSRLKVESRRVDSQKEKTS